MDKRREKIVIIEADAASRNALIAAAESTGCDVSAFAAAREGLDAVRELGADVLLLDSVFPGADAPSMHEMLAGIRGSAATEAVRVILLVGSGAAEREAGLDLGADDAVSRPWDAAELLARVRVQLQVRRADKQLLEEMHIAEEGQQIAYTAFDAIAVTEKMTRDAFSLERTMKIGIGAIFAIAVVMAGIYFLFVRSAQKNSQRTNITIAQLEGGIMHQQDLIAQARKLRAAQGPDDAALPGKDELQKHAADLKSKMASADPADVAGLQKELDGTNARLQRIEQEGDSVENLIRTDVQSVCLLHVSVAFRNPQTGKRLRYAGLNPQGDPIEDSNGDPVLTLDGNGPEVKLDFFGTGFLVGSGGRIITNRHVAEPWVSNDDISAITSQGFQAEISSIHAYFPGDPRALNAEIQQISKDADLSTMQVDMQDLKRPALSLDMDARGAVSGEPVVSMGYETGLAGILARTDENTAQQIMTSNSGDVSQVLTELARRDLIRPIITQGHVGDVLQDRIVFDAQTTLGGSGGPLFNHDGKVIGVTYAVLSGFGGSNFGIPIRLSQPLLAPAMAALPSN
ncbi:MAG: trypsin-like peptidase domain-containing protein [Candidatus Acidiferrales bacterium]